MTYELNTLTGMTVEEAIKVLNTMTMVHHIEVEEETEYFNGSIIVNYTYEFEIEDGKLLEPYEMYEE